MNLIRRVSLSLFDQGRAVHSGTDHFNRRRSTPHKYDRPQGSYSLPMQIDNDGAEIAAGIVYGYAWEFSPYPNKDGDLGPGVQVRQSMSERGPLIIRPDDVLWHRFILVTGHFPDYYVHGWMGVAHARRHCEYGKPDRAQSRPDCWLAAQEQLHAISLFPPMNDLSAYPKLRDLGDDYFLTLPRESQTKI